MAVGWSLGFASSDAITAAVTVPSGSLRSRATTFAPGTSWARVNGRAAVPKRVVVAMCTTTVSPCAVVPVKESEPTDVTVIRALTALPALPAFAAFEPGEAWALADGVPADAAAGAPPDEFVTAHTPAPIPTASSAAP